MQATEEIVRSVVQEVLTQMRATRAARQRPVVGRAVRHL